MKALIIGQNIRHALILANFCSEVVVLLDSTLKDYASNVSASEMSRIKIVESSVDRNKRGYFSKTIKEIKKLQKENKFDLILTNRKNDLVATYLATKNTNVIRIATFHNSYAWKKRLLVKLLVLCIDKFSHCNIALNSRAYKEIIKKKSLKNRTLFLPNTVDATTYREKTDYAFSHDGIIRVVFVGVISRPKNELFILETLKKFTSMYTFEISLFGKSIDETYREEIIRASQQHEKINVIFRGQVANDELKNILSYFDIYFAPSLCEMSPYNLQEAKSCGLPIIATNVSGQEDLIEDKKTGILIGLNGSNEDLNKISKLLSDIEFRANIGKNARIEMETRYSIENCAKKLKSFIEENKHN